MSAAPAEVIMVDGGLASLVACASAARGPGAVALFAPSHAAESPIQRTAAEEQAALFGLEFCALSPIDVIDPAEHETLILTRAAFWAGRAGIPRLTWTLHLGASDAAAWPDLDALAVRVDRALLAARLASLDAAIPVPEVRIELPYIDLSDRRLAELAADLAVPIDACWWWKDGHAGAGAAAAEHRRWTTLLKEVGWTVSA